MKGHEQKEEIAAKTSFIHLIMLRSFVRVGTISDQKNASRNVSYAWMSELIHVIFPKVVIVRTI
jgi:hypothetical protein